MILTKKIKKSIEMPTHIVCDSCDTRYSLNAEDGIEVLRAQEFFKIRKSNGFLSRFGDLTFLEIDLCENCFYDMLVNQLGKKLNQHVLNLNDDLPNEVITEN